MAAKPSKTRSRATSIIDRPATEFVAGKKNLALRLGISRTVVDSMFHKDGCPQLTSKGYHLPSFIAFAKIHFSRNNDKLDAMTGGTSSVPIPAGTPDLATVRMKHMLTQIMKLEQQMAIERGEFVGRDELQQELSAFLTELDVHFRRLFEQELPQSLEGRNALEIRTMLRLAYQEVKSTFVEKLTDAHLYEEETQEL